MNDLFVHFARGQAAGDGSKISSHLNNQVVKTKTKMHKICKIAGLVLLVIFLFGATGGVTAQAAENTGESKQGGSLATIGSIVVAIAGVFTGFFAWSENREKRKAQKEAREKEDEAREMERKKNQSDATLTEIRRGITDPVKLTVGEYRNSIMVLGLGGVGKTTVIQCLFQDKEANPNEVTKDFKFFQRRIQVNNIPGTTGQVWLNLFACDYRGQDLSTLTRTFVKQQLELYSPMAYGHIHSLILVVDLRFPKPLKDSPDVPVTKEPDEKRIERHLEQWNQTALDAIAGLLTAETRYICLFINRVDLLEDQTPGAKLRYSLLFEELRLRLVERFTPKPDENGVLPKGIPPKFDVVVAHAISGDGTTALSAGIAYSSVKVDK